jgi:uncharacterized protein
MSALIERRLSVDITRLAEYFPIVGIVGPRQVGKTTLARVVMSTWPKPCLFLDLEDPEHLMSLQQPALFLERFADHTVVIDEVQRMPALFPVLRVLVDRKREPGRFILLGSAAPDLIRQSSESLAGRIAYVELSPLDWSEIAKEFDYSTHWLRGGFPGSLLAPDDALSRDWRKNFVQTYLDRDLPQFGISADPILLGRLWAMLAHFSGGLVSWEKFSKSLSINTQTLQKYIRLYESAFLVRTLPPYIPNIPKRLVKSPKIYLRDTGIMHYLMAIHDWATLLGHPALGASWETYIVNQVAAILPTGYDMFFFRTQAGAEADLVLTKGGIPDILIEIKFSSNPTLSKGFRISQTDLQTKKQFVICPIQNHFPLAEDVEAIGLSSLNLLF